MWRMLDRQEGPLNSCHVFDPPANRVLLDLMMGNAGGVLTEIIDLQTRARGGSTPDVISTSSL
jgi:hypothetical protein